MNPVRTEVGQVAVLQALLMHSAAYTISSLEYSNPEAMLQKNVRTAEASEPGAYHPNMGFLTRIGRYMLISCKRFAIYGHRSTSGDTNLVRHIHIEFPK